MITDKSSRLYPDDDASCQVRFISMTFVLIFRADPYYTRNSRFNVTPRYSASNLGYNFVWMQRLLMFEDPCALFSFFWERNEKQNCGEDSDVV